MQKSKYAFTMIEVVFVIVILGILAAVAIPKFAATRTDAQISKGRADISSIRSAIMTERQTRLIKGDSEFISGIALNSNGGLFGGVLTYPVTDSTGEGHWHKTSEANASATYTYKIGNTICNFTYTRSTGKFDTNSTGDCLKLVD